MLYGEWIMNALEEIGSTVVRILQASSDEMLEQQVRAFVRQNFFFIVIFIMIGVIVGLLIQLTLSIIVYNHASNNNDPNALLWAIVVFFTSVVGIIIYLLVQAYQQNQRQTATSTPRICPKCGATLLGQEKYCQNCGTSVP